LVEVLIIAARVVDSFRDGRTHDNGKRVRTDSSDIDDSNIEIYDRRRIA
jgi:hypothetical protein